MPKVVLVTGASRGIGRAIALRFAMAGCHMIITCAKNEQALNQVKEEINTLGVPCLSYLGDLGNYDKVSSLFQTIKSNFHTLDIVINNAGISHIGLFTDMKPYEYQSLLSTNLLSAMNCCHLAIPLFVSKQSGTILNISSVWGKVGASCEVAYSASKGGMNAFTKALAKELAPSNITVNALALGMVDTSMNSSFTQEEKAAIMEEIPAGRMATPEEVAEFTYLICSSPSYLNGQIITFDGAWT